MNVSGIISDINSIIENCTEEYPDEGTDIYSPETLMDFFYLNTPFAKTYSPETLNIVFRKIQDLEVLRQIFDYLFSIKTTNGVIKPYISSVDYIPDDGRIKNKITIEEKYLQDIADLGYVGLVLLPNHKPSSKYVGCLPEFTNIEEYFNLVKKVMDTLTTKEYLLYKNLDSFSLKIVTSKKELVMEPNNGCYNFQTTKDYLRRKLFNVH